MTAIFTTLSDYRSAQVIRDMSYAARQPDSRLQVAGIAMTRAQFNVLFAEVDRAVKEFAIWTDLKLPETHDLGTALQVRRSEAATHWTEVFLGSFCARKESLWLALLFVEFT